MLKNVRKGLALGMVASMLMGSVFGVASPRMVLAEELDAEGEETGTGVVDGADIESGNEEPDAGEDPAAVSDSEEPDTEVNFEDEYESLEEIEQTKDYEAANEAEDISVSEEENEEIIEDTLPEEIDGEEIVEEAEVTFAEDEAPVEEANAFQDPEKEEGIIDEVEEYVDEDPDELFATADAAIAWVQSVVGRGIDDDGVYGNQCVDLIRAYYRHLGVRPVGGNAIDYSWNALPAGWGRYQGAHPQKGDIIIFGQNGYAGSVGHIAIYESDYCTYHQNYNYHSYVERIGHIYNSPYFGAYWGVIRPSFDQPAPVFTPPTGTQTIADGNYYIVSALGSDIALDISGGVDVSQGANVDIWRNMDQDADIFSVRYMGDGYYIIQHTLSKCALDVSSAGMDNGTNVQIWDYNGTDAQKWVIRDAGGGFFNIISKCNGKSLDVYSAGTNNGTNVTTWSGNGTDAQRWKFVAWGNGDGKTIADGDYHIVSALNDSKGLDVEGASDKSGTNVSLYANTTDDLQVFTLKYIGSGYYKIIYKKSGKVLDVESAGYVNGTNVQEWEDNGTDAQRWIIRYCGNGYFSIISKCNGRCIDVKNGSVEDFTNVWCYEPNGTNAQKWKFVAWGNGDGQTIADGDYHIVTALDETKGLGVEGTQKDSGANVEINENVTNDSQVFTLNYLGKGYYKITYKHSGKVLDVNGGGNANEVNVQVYDDNKTDAQQWIIRNCKNGYFNIISKCNGRCLDVKDGNKTNMTNIWCYEPNGTNAQKWKFIPYSKSNEENNNSTEDIPITGISLDKTSLNLKKGESATLAATVLPKNATNKDVVWKSDNEGVATVSQAGVVEGIRAGNTVISVATKEGDFTAECKVTVAEPVTDPDPTPEPDPIPEPSAVAVTGVGLNKTALNLEKGETETLVATISPDDASNKDVTWASSDEDVAAVSKSGTVKAMGAGHATITATTQDGGYRARCEVAVKTGSDIPTEPDDPDDSNSYDDYEDPDGYDDSESDDPDDSDNYDDFNEPEDEEIYVTGVSLNKANLNLLEGKSATLVAAITPSDATNQNVIWESDDESVAKVSDIGVVGAVKAGTTTIIVTTEDGGETAECIVRVTKKTVKVSKVTLSKSTASVAKGRSLALSATVSPSNATNKSVTWKSSNAKIATVSSKGVVTGVKAGTAIISVVTNDGGKRVSYKVTVTNPVVKVKSVKLSSKSSSIKKGRKLTLRVVISPSNATNKEVTWKTSNKKIATVTNKGVVKGVKKGTATITVTTKDGKKTAKCKVTVK